MTDTDESGDDHAGKRVVARSGGRVGTVDEVRDGGLYAEVDPDPTGRCSTNWAGTAS